MARSKSTKRVNGTRGAAGSMAGSRTRVGRQRLGDSITVSGAAIYGGISSNAGGYRDGIASLVPFNAGTAIENITTCFELYRVDAAHVQWIPGLGMTSGGRIQFAYLDNPEHIMRWSEYSEATRMLIVMSSPKVAAGKLTEPLRFTIPCQSPRRRWFSVDKAGPVSVAEYDRIVQGAVIYYIFGAPTSVDCGALKVSYDKVALRTQVPPVAQLPTLVSVSQSAQDVPGEDPVEPPSRFPLPGTLG